MRICTYYYSDAKDKTSINMSEAFWELSPIQQLDVLRDIACDAKKVYVDHLDRWHNSSNKRSVEKYIPQIDLPK